MRLSREQERILKGREGRILQYAMSYLVRYGTAMEAEELIPITSAHTIFKSLNSVAQIFSPPGALLTKNEIDRFGESLAKLRVKARTTINITYADLDNWRRMGADEETYHSVKQGVDVAKRCGMLPTCSCTPYLMYNIPQMGEHCSWSESSAFLYCNGMLGAHSNRDCAEVSLASALLGITPNFGMHIGENRAGTHRVDVRCELKHLSDWGALGYFAGEASGLGTPVFTGVKSASVEEVKQLCAGINTSGAAAMFHIPGVTPEAPDLESALGGNRPKGETIFDDAARAKVYDRLNRDPDGKVGMVCIGCPFCTPYEIMEIARLIEGKRISPDTRLWVLTDYPTRYLAERLGYDRIIKAAGGELVAGGCPQGFETDACRVGRFATNSAKQAYYAAGVLGNKIVFENLPRCIEIAVKGGT